MSFTTTLRTSNVQVRRCYDDVTKGVDANPQEKEKKNEQRSRQTHGESGNLNQQREVARSNSQVTEQTVHVFAVPEL